MASCTTNYHRKNVGQDGILSHELSSEKRGTRWHLVPRIIIGKTWDKMASCPTNYHRKNVGQDGILSHELSSEKRGTRWHLVPRIIIDSQPRSAALNKRGIAQSQTSQRPEGHSRFRTSGGIAAKNNLDNLCIYQWHRDGAAPDASADIEL